MLCFNVLENTVYRLHCHLQYLYIWFVLNINSNNDKCTKVLRAKAWNGNLVVSAVTAEVSKFHWCLKHTREDFISFQQQVEHLQILQLSRLLWSYPKQILQLEIEGRYLINKGNEIKLTKKIKLINKKLIAAFLVFQWRKFFLAFLSELQLVWYVIDHNTAWISLWILHSLLLYNSFLLLKHQLANAL